VIYALALLLSYGLCFGAMNKATKVFPVLWLLRLGHLPEADEEAPLGFSNSRWRGAVRAFVTKLFSCPYCMGFHTGWMSWLLVWLLSGERLLYSGQPYSLIPAMLCWSLISSSACYIIDSAVLFLERSA